MAEIDTSGGGGHGKGGGKVRGKKMSTRVDMTPMVDLGFLLITFFMLATTMSKPTSMTLSVPHKEKDETRKETEPLKASKVLTIFMGKFNDVYLLDGVAADDEKATEALQKVSYGSELRDAIFKAKQRVNASNPAEEDGSEPFVAVIKPTPVSTYKNLVDVLDEMAITKTQRYAMVDNLTDAEKKLLGDKIAP